MIKETTENLYPFIASQLPRKYDQRCKRTFFDDKGSPYHTTLIVCKGPNHYLVVSYEYPTQDFKISIRKPQGWINEVTIHKYA